MPCVWLFAAVVLGEYEKDTVNAAAVSRPADWIEGGVPTPAPRTRTTKSPTVKRARRLMIYPRRFPLFELYAEVRRADNDTGLSSRIFNPNRTRRRIHVGRMFWVEWNRLPGSYFPFS